MSGTVLQNEWLRDSSQILGVVIQNEWLMQFIKSLGQFVRIWDHFRNLGTVLQILRTVHLKDINSSWESISMLE